MVRLSKKKTYFLVADFNYVPQVHCSKPLQYWIKPIDGFLKKKETILIPFNGGCPPNAYRSGQLWPFLLNWQIQNIRLFFLFIAILLFLSQMMNDNQVAPCLTCDTFAEHQLLYQLLNTQYLLYIVIWSSYYMVLQYYYIKANLVNILLVVTCQKVKRSNHVAYFTYFA